MSKYTTELRYICEVEAGLSESKGYNQLDTILTAAAPNIFNFSFPIFDESYRLILEKKILRHFYTREISEETYGLWKLRLEDKMNLIMPYYNKMYQSELLEFNPLYDTDYTVNHTGLAEDTIVETNNNTRTFNKDTDTTETDNNTRTLNTTETTNNTRTLNTTEELENTRTLNTTEQNSNTRTLNTTDSESNSSANKNVRWDLYSDTPQGGINGITNDNDSVANNTYLSNARKITDDGTGSTSSRQLTQSGTIGDSGSKTNTGTIGDSGSKTDTGTIGDSGSKTDTGTIGDSGTRKDSGTIQDAATRNNSVEERGTIGDLGGRNVNSNNTNSYVDRVAGKRGTMSYGKMIQEFRESLLRIDEMVINELEPLFFGLW